MEARHQDFPRYRPDIRIRSLVEKSFRIDFKEMVWWFVLPEAGDRVGYGSYDGEKDDNAPWRLFKTVWLTVRRAGGDPRTTLCGGRGGGRGGGRACRKDVLRRKEPHHEGLGAFG